MNKFEHYIDAYLSSKETKKHKLSCEFHLISYHYNHIENYAYTLSKLKELSLTQLKYCRKTTLTCNNVDYSFMTSDVHIEIDFELLGVIEYGLFFEYFKHIQENIILNKKHIYVVCLHFHLVSNELLEVFFNFLNNPLIHFIFLTCEVSALPLPILKRSKIKRFKSLISSSYDKTYQQRINNIVKHLVEETNVSLFTWREFIYELLVYNDPIHEAYSYMIFELIQKEFICLSQLDNVFQKYYEVIHLYNNNYRSIYHLEYFIVYLRNLNKKK